jgi:hypothetical protein
MILSKPNRDRILSVASWLDSMAASLRAFVKRTTPKRKAPLPEAQESLHE